MLRDIAETNGFTESLALETTLDTALLPIHPDAKFWVEDLYGNGCLAESLMDYFAYIAMGVNWGVKENPDIDIVHFFSKCLRRKKYIINGKDHQLDYLRIQWQTVVELIDGKDGGYAQSLLNNIPVGATQIEPFQYVNTIVMCWDWVYMHTCTFRFLSFIARLLIGSLQETAFDRVYFCNRIKETASLW